jgi:hypothetical protein
MIYSETRVESENGMDSWRHTTRSIQSIPSYYVDNIASYSFLPLLIYSLIVGESFNIDLDVVAYVLVTRLSKVSKTTRSTRFEGLS